MKRLSQKMVEDIGSYAAAKTHCVNLRDLRSNVCFGD